MITSVFVILVFAISIVSLAILHLDAVIMQLTLFADTCSFWLARPNAHDECQDKMEIDNSIRRLHTDFTSFFITRMLQMCFNIYE